MSNRKYWQLAIGMGALALMPLIPWMIQFRRGKQFALRDRLQKSDAIVVLAGARGNINYLNGKIKTAVKLYKQGWAPNIICSGRFSVAITNTPHLIPHLELEHAVAKGRIQPKDVANAAKTWDEGLGARFMREQIIALGVPSDRVIAEDESLHTRENAEFVCSILERNNMRSIILVTSPFHQIRTYLTFGKILQPVGIKIINYFADTGEWNPVLWFVSSKQRKLVASETERIKKYREKGDLL